MIGWGPKPPTDGVQDAQAQGFDTFEMRLGDLMRGERATLGKSLLDVQRELKIKAGYIAAIENCDPSAFETPGFIAGYVRSYARYLGMDPEWAFATFCDESGFETAHGMSKEASGTRPEPQAPPAERDIFEGSATPFLPEADPLFSGVEPRAVGSVAVLGLLILGLGYGAWSVLQEVQRVQFAPVEQTPEVATSLDPLAGNAGREVVARPSAEAFDRLYRPRSLDVPVMAARDAPIATLDPRISGSFAAPRMPSAPRVVAQVQPATPTAPLTDAPQVQVTAEPLPGVQLVAVRPAWVRVRSAGGAVLFEGTMQPGDTYAVPQTETAPTLRIGDSGAVYFAMNGQHYGPVGARGQVSSGVELAAEVLAAGYSVADLTSDRDLACRVQVAGTLPAGMDPFECN